MTYQLSSINTVLLPQFQSYTDQYGLITDNNLGNPSGNGILYTSYYAAGLSKKNQLDQEKVRLLQVFANNFMQPGLYCRNPSFPGDREAQDDGFGIMAADAFLNPNTRDFTKAILNYGKNTTCNGIDSLDTTHSTINKFLYWPLKIVGLGKIRYVWNNISPNTFSADSWLGRFLNFTATMEMATQTLVNPFLWLYWAFWILSMYIGAANNNDYLLKWCSAIAVEKHGFFTKTVCKLLYSRINKEYGSFSGLLSSYFNNPNNPLPAFLEGVTF
jgi:hypothetical protein